MSEYTPEKVTELARRLRGDILDAVPDDGDMQSVLDLAADALAAVSAERDAARHWAETMQAQKFEWENREAEARIDRDRLHKAITEALAVRLDRNLPLHRAWPRYQDDVDRILHAALDKEGSDDE